MLGEASRQTEVETERLRAALTELVTDIDRGEPDRNRRVIQKIGAKSAEYGGEATDATTYETFASDGV